MFEIVSPKGSVARIPYENNIIHFISSSLAINSLIYISK